MIEMERNFDSEFRRKLLETFKFTADFLEEHDLRWYAAYGTAIGAVRHHGMIPWDDDVDIFMPYEDYMRLLNIRERLRDTKYRVDSFFEPNYYCPYAKVCDTSTTIWESRWLRYISGVWVDIFPLYQSDVGLPEFNDIRHRFSGIVHNYQKSISRCSARDFFTYLRRGHPRAAWHSVRSMFYRPFADKFKRQYTDFERQLNDNRGKWYIFPFTYTGIASRFPMECFRESALVDFADFKVRIPSGNHEILTQLYGDYMMPPPVGKRVSPHSPVYANLKERLTLREVKERLKRGETRVF